MKIPKSLQGVLWSKDVFSLDAQKDKSYIVHQILMYGNFEDIRWLFKTYPEDEIKKVFIKNPRKVYTKEAFHYIKDYVLGLEPQKLPKDDYVNTFYSRS